MVTASDLHHIRLTINGRPYEASVPARRTLVDFLRYDLGLTGTKEACSVGVCGACTILMDGRIVASKALLDENPKPTEDEIKEWLMGNLCRCTGYYQIIESVKAASGQAVS